MKKKSGWGGIVECLMTANFPDSGIGYVTVLTDNGSDSLRYVNFLVDSFCLGVKNLDYHKIYPSEYQTILERLAAVSPLMRVSPADAKKFIEGAVSYAANLGFKPHEDFPKYFKCLADIDSSECLTEFSYGLDGKPMYVQGPRDSLNRAKSIVQRLRSKLGDGEFNYSLVLTTQQMQQLQQLQR
jgi:hypothetical protein